MINNTEEKFANGFGIVAQMFDDILERQRWHTRDFLDDIQNKDGRITFRRHTPFTFHSGMEDCDGNAKLRNSDGQEHIGKLGSAEAEKAQTKEGC